MNGVSLFANVGIAETYLSEVGVDIVVANELLPERAKFYSAMHPNCSIINGDITDTGTYEAITTLAAKHNCDFLIATPPCQGMSIAGKMAEDDPRNSLIKYVVSMITDLQPTYALIENVEGVLKTYISVNGVKTRIVDFITESLKPLGYTVNYGVVNAQDYGTPQSRKRAIFLISKSSTWKFPRPKAVTTVREAIAHLPSLESGQSSDIPYHSAKVHNDRHIMCMRHTPSGKTAQHNPVHFPKKEDGTRAKSFDTSYKRISWDKPAPTITMANGSISSQNNVHPGRPNADGTYSDARVLTLKEIFILTGLPDDWTPPKWASDNLIRQVIGEGVPPRLIQALLSTLPNTTKES